MVAWVAAAVAYLYGPFFDDLSKLGHHDWDSHAACRQLTVLSLRAYGEMPWWQPYLAGGMPGWAYSEGAPNLVSPFFPFYWFLPIQVAMRCELVGCVVIGLVTSYLLARRLSKSIGLCAFVAVVHALNGRATLQLAEGHSWHAHYAWLPLAIYFFDVAVERRSGRHALYAGATLALMVYVGAIYPAPHLALALFVYAVVIAAARQSLYPIALGAVVAISGAMLAAPKLLPMVELMQRYPRQTESNEMVTLGQLVDMLVSRDQSIMHGPFVSSPWGWHEYGIYIGVPATVLLVIGACTTRGVRGQAFRICGVLFAALGLGAFASLAPWSILHCLPIFSSHHVPTRFLYVAVLFLALAFIARVTLRVEQLVARWPIVDLLLVALVGALALDLADRGRASTAVVFVRTPPTGIVRATFQQANDPPKRSTPADPSDVLVAMAANAGCLRCYGGEGMPPPAPTPKDSPFYGGEAYFPEGVGRATIDAWTPNRATIHFQDARPGSTLVYNMSFDPNWRIDGTEPLNANGLVATIVSRESGTVTFAYRPRLFAPGVALALMGLLVFVAWTPLTPIAARLRAQLERTLRRRL